MRRVVVIEGPEPIITPADIPGGHSADDPLVTAMIAAAQAQIDGPTGWLGRALGEQTLELRADSWPGCLPYRPLIEIESVTVDGEPVEDVDVEFDGVLILPPRLPRPSRELRIRYRAGYDGRAIDEGGTGAVPANAKAAVILATNLMRSLGEGDVFLQQEAVVGAHSMQRTVSPYVAQTIENAVGNLLAPLRIWA